MNIDDLANLLNAADAAKYLGVTVTRINALRSAGKIGIRIGNYWLYSKKELDHYRATKKNGRPVGYSPKKRKEQDHGKDKKRESTEASQPTEETKDEG